jgi:GTP-binding protein HflX
MQKAANPDSKTYVGKGKIEEIRDFTKAENIDMVVFDDELSPSQIRNLELYLECKILDRSNLILDIFAGRAKTAQAKTQVELAQFQYLLPRLTRMWTHLSKQKGGIGMKGPGETEIETDRRIVRDRISLLKEKLSTIDRQNSVQRKNRGEFVRVALVGYTNVGKSTLLNLLSKSEVLAEDKLFATLDTTVRKIVIENLPLLISDTVGFIRKLPTNLIESFKSTLDEVREADILLHIVDISHPGFEDQIKTVNQTLHEIGVSDKLIITVFNKVDSLLQDPLQYPSQFHTENPLKEGLHQGVNQTESGLNLNQDQLLEKLKKSWVAKEHEPCLFISASKNLNIEELRTDLYKIALELHLARYPHNGLLY